MKPPEKRIRLTVDIRAHDWRSLAEGLRRLALEVDLGQWQQPQTNGFGSGDVDYRVGTYDEGVEGLTKEEYDRALQEYVAWLRARDKV